MCFLDAIFWTNDADGFCMEKTRTAVKQHSCCDCGKAIKKGSRYRRRKVLAFGKFSELKFCIECMTGMLR